MNWTLHEFIYRLKYLVRRKAMSHEMAEELDFHQSKLRERLLREGVPLSEIDAATRRAFGNADRWQERLRELRQFRGLENFLRDVTYSVRLLSRSPGFTLVALLTLALGVGANTAVFSMINALLLRPLPVPHAEQLVVLNWRDGGHDPEYDFNAPYFRSLENERQIFTNVFAYNPDTMLVQGQTGTENVLGVLVSGQYFDALQTAPLLGRVLTAADDVRGGSPAGWAVVISEDFWERRFNRAADVVGRRLVIANVPFTVVGVMPKQFVGADPTQRPEIFAPLEADPVIDAPRNHIDDAQTTWLTVMARRQEGISLAKVNAALESVSLPIVRAKGDAEAIDDAETHHFRFAAEPGSKGFTYARLQFSQPLVTMAWMCGGVLVLACLNLAGLLLARSAARQQELATRMAMGGSRRRLIQQLLVESMLVATAGTAVGLAVSPLVSRSLAAVLMSGNASSAGTLILDTSLDLRVFGFGALVAVVSTVLIGLLPALRATGKNLSEQIKTGQCTTKSQGRSGMLPRILLASEVALALVLVIGAGLLATSLVRLFTSGVGFEPKGLVNFAFKMDIQPLKGDALMRVYQQIGEGLSHQPGVQDVSFESIVPLSGRGQNGNFAAPGGAPLLLQLNAVAPDYFHTMRIPMRMGRDFQWNDTNDSGMKIILNEKAAQAMFPGRSAIGQQVTRIRDKVTFEVVAVVGNAKYRNVRSPAPAGGYVPIQQDDARSLHAVVRVDARPGELMSLDLAARAVTARLVPSVPAPVMTTVEDVMNRSVSAERLMAMLSVFFAVCALLVMAIGLYGTLAYATVRRTSEIGVRLALGARRGSVLAMVFRENLVVAAVGCGAGLVVALLAAKALGSFLYGTSEHDPLVLGGSVAMLVLIASAASLLPAIRAAMVSPQTALRHE